MAKSPKAPKSDYKVGHGKPPQSGQFKPGHSGNIKGRPKGLPTTDQIFVREAARLAKVDIGGKFAFISKKEVVMRQLFNLAAKGDLRAMAMIFNYEARMNNGQEFAPGNEPPDLAAMSLLNDGEVLSRISARLQHVLGKKDEPHENA